jgi:aminoglycoside 6-adenylyltransferase
MDKHQLLLKRIIDYAKTDNRVRLVEMNGSRVNPTIKADDYQDFDIVFYVNHFGDFDRGKAWVQQFGDILIMQTKDDQIPEVNDTDDWYVYLIQFKDGTRLDLTIMDISSFNQEQRDSLSKILLDKDHLSQSKASDESSYYVKEPQAKNFSMTVNEFYWVCPYISKGLVRGQIIYAMKHLDIIRKQYEKILDWWIGHQYNYQISVGKGKSRYRILLDRDVFDRYIQSYVPLYFDDILNALLVMMDDFDQMAKRLAEKLNFEYDLEIKDKIKNFILNQLKK